MRIAVISDIHGNSWALEKVLRDIETRKPDLIVNLGDVLYGPLDPTGTFEMLKPENIITISGNQDRSILESLQNGASNATMEYILSQLNDEAFEWLNTFPVTKTIEDTVFLCHGTPKSDMIYLLEELNNNYRSVNKSEKIEELLNDVKEEIILCGHSHFPRYIEIKRKKIVNPGSVGLPAYDDDQPLYHKVENFSPNARYCMVETGPHNLKIEQISVPYDFEKAASCAERNNRRDWAKWLRSGRV